VPTVALLVGREPSHRFSVHRGYPDAVWAVGATPVALLPPSGPDAIERYVDAALRCDAVCATGGGDVLIEPAEGLMDTDPLRDAAESAAVLAAVAAGRPLLGVCRGIQLITVALGGTLHRDLPVAGFTGHWEEQRQYEPVHSIDADHGSAAHAALGGAGTVNSIHHQAVADPGRALRASAWSGDGVIEAVEAPGVLGVQWHPERLAGSDHRHLAPFRWLVAA
jgi:putative glutamine amidotransferase